MPSVMSAAAHDLARRAALHAEIDNRYRAKKPKQPFSLTAIRIAELRRLFLTRHGFALPDDDKGRCAALVMAHHLAHRSGDQQQRIGRWLELNAPWMTSSETSSMINAVIAKPLRWRADKLAMRLHVTEAERSRLHLTTIGATDMTKAERRKRRRERDRIRRSHQRRAKGAKPRAEYEAKSVSRTKPWEAGGMSRRTWYRRGKPNGGTSASAA